MKKRNLISLEDLEYEVFKNEVKINKPKIKTLDEVFKISIISRVPPARANQQPNSQTAE